MDQIEDLVVELSRSETRVVFELTFFVSFRFRLFQRLGQLKIPHFYLGENEDLR